MKIANPAVLNIIHTSQDCNEYNHNAEHNLAHLGLHAPQNVLAKDYFRFASAVIKKPLDLSFIAPHDVGYCPDRFQIDCFP